MQLLTHGITALTLSSIGTGGMFSPPAVIKSSTTSPSSATSRKLLPPQLTATVHNQPILRYIRCSTLLPKNTSIGTTKSSFGE
jgi:hypothetical protein